MFLDWEEARVVAGIEAIRLGIWKGGETEWKGGRLHVAVLRQSCFIHSKLKALNAEGLKESLRVNIWGHTANAEKPRQRQNAPEGNQYFSRCGQEKAQCRKSNGYLHLLLDFLLSCSISTCRHLPHIPSYPPSSSPPGKRLDYLIIDLLRFLIFILILSDFLKLFLLSFVNFKYDLLKF